MILFIVLGFCAQIIDGCLGMAYGVFLTTFLVAGGVPLVNASSAIHFSEIFTTLASGLSHWKFKNIDWTLFKKLTVSGVLGGVAGAYLLTSINGEKIKPFVSAYLLLLGLRILWKVKQRCRSKKVSEHLIPLGVLGGFCDAIGGGGWGPIVTSSLIVKDRTPRHVIGTVNSAEFFVTAAQSATVITLIGLGNSRIILGLIIGGILAAPISAWLCSRINQKVLMTLVALLIILTNAYALYHGWGKI